MRHHTKYDEVTKLVKANIPVLLTGEAGSGKTTLIKHIAEDMKLKFYTISMTRQTTLSHLLGFISVNGNYIPSNLRKCFEFGGLMLLDEIDAGDPNVMLSLNTIENGYISFPDELVESHPDFRIAATANPQDQHNFYTGRSKLDGATLDRFDIIDVDRDEALEKTLVDEDTFMRMTILRKIMTAHNAAKPISMRDSVRYQKRKDLNILDNTFVMRLTDKSDLVYEQYMKEVDAIPKHRNQSDCETLDELNDLLSVRAGNKPQPETPTDDPETSHA